MIPYDHNELRSLYTEHEIAVFSVYLGLHNSDRLEGAVEQIYLDQYYALEAEVARILLGNVEDRLPSYYVEMPNSDPQSSGKADERRDSKISVLPQFLFSINWANTGPGLSWPEYYYAGYLPGFDVFIVTISTDSEEAYGCKDMAIGFFPSSKGFYAGARDTIVEWWKGPENAETYRWEEALSAGAIDFKSIHDWADLVWGSDVGG